MDNFLSYLKKNKKYVFVLLGYVLFFLLPRPSSKVVFPPWLWWVAMGVGGIVACLIVLWLVVMIVRLSQRQQTSTTTPEQQVCNQGKWLQNLFVFFVFVGAIILGYVCMPKEWLIRLFGAVPENVPKLAPYVTAPLLGVFAYFFSRRGSGYRKLSYAIVVTGFTALAITFWIYPEVFRAVLEPYFGGESFLHLTTDGGYRMYIFIGVLFILSLLTGYVIEGIVGLALLLFMWCL